MRSGGGQSNGGIDSGFTHLTHLCHFIHQTANPLIMKILCRLIGNKNVSFTEPTVYRSASKDDNLYKHPPIHPSMHPSMHEWNFDMF